jgi:hypothetical protein
MEDSFNEDLKSFLDKVGNRWVISPDPDMFGEPNDPVVECHMNHLKSIIGVMPRPYTTELFEKVRVAREEELLMGNDENAGLDEAKKGFNEEGGGCFFLHSKVILANGKRIEVSQLNIGDKVFCGEKNGKLIFSEIYAIIHADNQTLTQYQRIDYLKADGTDGNK